MGKFCNWSLKWVLSLPSWRRRWNCVFIIGVPIKVMNFISNFLIRFSFKLIAIPLWILILTVSDGVLCKHALNICHSWSDICRLRSSFKMFWITANYLWFVTSFILFILTLVNCTHNINIDRRLLKSYFIVTLLIIFIYIHVL